MDSIENHPDYNTRTDHMVRTLDVVAQVARILANQMVAGPEKTRLQRVLLRYVLAYARSIRAQVEEEPQEPQETLSYTLPNGHPQSVDTSEIERNIKNTLDEFTQQFGRSAPAHATT